LKLQIQDKEWVTKAKPPGPAKLPLGGDYYSIAYISFIKNYRDKHNIS